MRWVFLLVIVSAVRIFYWSADRDETEKVCGRLGAKGFARVKGRFSSNEKGVFLSRPSMEVVGIQSVFDGRVYIANVPPELPPQGSAEFLGFFRCHFETLNPGQRRLLRFQKSRLAAVGKVAVTGVEPKPTPFLERLFHRYPALLAFQKGLWEGAWDDEDSAVFEVYRAGGLLHVLALSGQHVAVLAGILHLILAVACWPIPKTLRPKVLPMLFRVRRLLPVIAASTLCITSNAAPSMVRALACVVSAELLLLYRLHSTTFQRLATSAALLIVIAPSLVTSVGFILSVVATAWMGRDLGRAVTWGEGVSGYFKLMIRMSVCMMPLTIFFFGRLPLLSPILNILFVWLWELALLPVGFVLPLVFCVAPSALTRRIGEGWELGWKIFELLHAAIEPVVEKSWVFVPSINWVELILVEVALFHCFFPNKKFK